MGEIPSSDMVADMPLLDERAVSMLRWRSRRGMVENDLFIERFFTRFASQLHQRHADGMNALMDLADNDLLDLLLRRREPEGALNTEEVREVLGMMRQGGSGATAPAHG
ncbi:MAG: succinate dehydrogenase assembly factor 2 [Giesbergeria sp.]|uniref:succinate dehydrogenase assembly factor 2 n=1 Tax=Giesbergeria sp. TaxID=2818473 RepID=UPI002606A949|nr:succinate dehydrogenase assembly factor 2 [Giesbergeria sp.]MDD2610318.1 succinate dehydrogenase assembly factor 2 [Giesbergeria sp.]